ncbi:MAG: three-Cys-motif partner protein TcmP [Amylibacter sp.]|nr:three-Cys-motif partner protein TcmP [Amylibacter sp.]
MVISNHYDWQNGAKIEPHSLVKLEILDEYLREYVNVRCGLPQQEHFRLSVVDGFCGGGLYSCGTSGSPLVILKALNEVSTEINFRRQIEGFKQIDFQFFLYFNDIDPNAIEAVKVLIKNCLEEFSDNGGKARYFIEYFEGDFQSNLAEMSDRILTSKVRNSLFNLDQYGYSNISEETLQKVMSLTNSSEVFLTFSIKSFLAFLSPHQRQQTRIFNGSISEVSLHKNKKAWLADVERLVYEEFNNLASYVSPFSINGEKGWEYWLVHFANAYRARQVYNDILHRKKNSQAHMGRSGLQMLRYSSYEETSLYLFDRESRQVAKAELLSDIPQYLTDRVKDQIISVEQFYEKTYNQTPAHSDDINGALIKSSELEVLTTHGGKRRKPQMIKKTDIVRLAPQRIFHFGH